MEDPENDTDDFIVMHNRVYHGEHLRSRAGTIRSITAHGTRRGLLIYSFWVMIVQILGSLSAESAKTSRGCFPEFLSFFAPDYGDEETMTFSRIKTYLLVSDSHKSNFYYPYSGRSSLSSSWPFPKLKPIGRNHCRSSMPFSVLKWSCSIRSVSVLYARVISSNVLNKCLMFFSDVLRSVRGRTGLVGVRACHLRYPHSLHCLRNIDGQGTAILRGLSFFYSGK